MALNDNVWSDKDSMMYLNNNKLSFHCDCRCNVFRKNLNNNKAKCNSCGAIYYIAHKKDDINDIK